MFYSCKISVNDNELALVTKVCSDVTNTTIGNVKHGSQYDFANVDDVKHIIFFVVRYADTSVYRNV